ncbi:DUF4190 domain-containing protein [Serinicoccus chungangensis]|uniref:DUF4190 domain-containing protein n=1 Tax=Serinicoccus chungangensis TaxID=767452 RepID=UPI00111882BA|nr:DUF4190 domain-containing protein [Serinicoccus chungangensis]
MYRFEPPPTPQFGGGSEPDDPYAEARPRHPRPSTSRHAPASAASRPWASPAAPAPPRAAPALVLGILSVCGFAFLGPLAWVVAHRALREIDRSHRPVRHRWQFVVAQALGVVGSCVLALWGLGLAALVALGIILG